jgi:hypothetical protein
VCTFRTFLLYRKKHATCYWEDSPHSSGKYFNVDCVQLERNNKQWTFLLRRFNFNYQHINIRFSLTFKIKRTVFLHYLSKRNYINQAQY